MEIKPIARIFTDFPDKFGLPRQSMLVEGLTGRIVFEPEYRIDEALRGLEGFSHIWLIWGFSRRFASDRSSPGNVQFSPTVRPPRLGGNVRVGVFATRSPNRPNPLALSCVKILDIKKEPDNGTVIYVSGIDMADGSPVYDIKPYISLSDSVPDAVCGFTESIPDSRPGVVFTDEVRANTSEEFLDVLSEILMQDPRPQYQKDEAKTYSFSFRGKEITFTAQGRTFTVTCIE